MDYKIVYDTTPGGRGLDRVDRPHLRRGGHPGHARGLHLPAEPAGHASSRCSPCPVSLIGTFIFFPLLGFSVNTLSMFGLVLAIGIVVDDAIVVVEAVMHHIEHGMSPQDATDQAMKEVSAPVIGIALILSAVFIPVAFIGGLTGRCTSSSR